MRAVRNKILFLSSQKILPKYYHTAPPKFRSYIHSNKHLHSLDLAPLGLTLIYGCTNGNIA